MSAKNYRLEPEFANKFMYEKKRYDAVSEAIRTAKKNGLEDKDITSLITLKQSLKQVCSDNTSEMLNKMVLANNVIRIEDNWFGIRYVNEKGDLHAKIDPIIEQELYLILRDGRKERELSRIDIESLIPSVQDGDALSMYKQEIVDLSFVLFDELGIKLPKSANSDNGSPILVSSHAKLRWAQRKLGMVDEARANQYLRANVDQIEKDIIESFNKSELIWIGNDDIKYYFDPDNITYVVGRKNSNFPDNIITLYEQDFGFSKEINRSIVLKQIDVLKSAESSMVSSKEKHAIRDQLLDRELCKVSEDINILESQINRLKARKSTLYSTKEELLRTVTVSEATFNAELQKLFRKS